MKLKTIVENVEKLLPHLKASIENYLKLRTQAVLPNPIQPAQAAQAVEWVLRCDPMFNKGKNSGKPLSHIKSPFAKHIIRWWLDPKSDNSIELPEDIEVIGEMLKKFSNAKQRGLNVETSTIDTWTQLVELITPYLTADETTPVDHYSRMGFKMIFHDGPWKVYMVNKWIDGAPSTLYPGQLEHKAFEGAQWCVKYKTAFTNAYSPSIFGLVLYKERKFALIHINTLQFAFVNNQSVASQRPHEGLDFLQRFFAAKPKIFHEIILQSLNKPGFDQFATFIPLLDIETPNPQELQAAAEKKNDARTAMKAAQVTKEWPHFKNWPNGKQILMSSINQRLNAANPLLQLVKDIGRIPEVEQSAMRSTPELVEYVQAVFATSLFPKSVNATDAAELGELINASLLDYIKEAHTRKTYVDMRQLLATMVQCFAGLEKYGVEIGTTLGNTLQSVIEHQSTTHNALYAAESALQVAKITGQWPYFENWPNGKQILIKSVTSGVNQQSPAIKLVAAVGRIPEIEKQIAQDLSSLTQYTMAVIAPSEYSKSVDISDIKDLGRLMNLGVINAIKDGGDVSQILRTGDMSFLNKYGVNNEIPELEQAILDTDDPKAVVAYAGFLGKRWPPGEQLLKYDERLAIKYCKKFDIHISDLASAGEDSIALEVRVAIKTGQESDNEELILTDLDAALMYAQHVVGPWPELEELLEKHGTPAQQTRYRVNVLRL